MILYRLTCACTHGFEAWFKDGATYELQAANREIVCPLCGDTRIRKAPMAPRILRRSGPDRAENPPQSTQGAAPGPDKSGAGSPALPPPAASSSSSGPPLPAPPLPTPSLPGPPSPGDPVRTAFLAQLHTALRALRQNVETHCDYVGERFADEARRIHYGETDPRGIYGETTPEEAEELRDEGVAFQQIPWLPRNHS